MDAKHITHNPFFKIGLFAGCWNLWIHKNRIIFDRDLDVCYNLFKEAIILIKHRVKPSLKEGTQDWIDTL
jgi:hypothetical protein